MRALTNLRSRLNKAVIKRLGLLNAFGARLTIIDQFGSPGDTLMTATVCRNIHERHPRIRINCRTANPSLIEHDPAIETLNAPLTRWHTSFQYIDLLVHRRGDENALAQTMAGLGMAHYEYKAKVHLTQPELRWAAAQLRDLKRPIITVNTVSKERVKTWPQDYWAKLLEKLKGEGSVVQLGDSREPLFEGVHSFAGKLSLRESMAILSQASLHIGPDSFLMHAANGVDVRSIIIFGGSRTPGNVGYAENINLFVQMPCGPCYLHDSRGQLCPHDIACMSKISVEEALRHAREALAGMRPARPNHAPIA
ncbi:MAG TPA: glycosyltransferase family 9 protein [Methylomirabilota bacterium]|nr:glycosyltransferase family 9 protein [Methylomirabilota bacterium]